MGIRESINLIEMIEKRIISEGKSHPVIVVDVQPEYSGINDGDEDSVFPEIIDFVLNQTGKVLMYVNAEKDGLTGDTVDGVKEYWNDTVEDLYDGDKEIDWDRFTIEDKGYGYFRSWMDLGAPESLIIKLIRELYTKKLNDSRELFDEETFEEDMREFAGGDFEGWMLDEPLIINWTSVAMLKEFNGAYIVGGGRNECLREVELLMNAFNIKYKRIDSLVYG